MKNFCLLCLLVSFSYLFSSCGLINPDPIDYPPSSSQLKGPKRAELETQTIALTKVVDFPFSGSIRKYESLYLLRGYNENANRNIFIESNKVVELSSKPLYDLFLDRSGGIWGITLNGTQATISQHTNGRWQDYAVLSGDSYFYDVVKAEPAEFRFVTSKGLIVWDVQQKTVKQIIPAERARVATKNYLVGLDGENLTLYDNQAQSLLASWKLSNYVDAKRGISNGIWGAFEDNQNNIWLVVKDGNWDGVLLKYDGSTLQKLSLIPVGYYDSGRSVSNFNIDKKGDLWLNVDGVNYIYTKAGKWIRPVFNSINKDYNPGIFSDGQGNLTLTEGSALYSVDQ